MPGALFGAGASHAKLPARKGQYPFLIWQLEDVRSLDREGIITHTPRTPSWANAPSTTAPHSIWAARHSGLSASGVRKDWKQTMSKSLIDLQSILDIEPIEVNLFRGNSPKTSWQAGC